MKLTLFLLALSAGLHFYSFDSDFKSSVLQSLPWPPRARPEPGFDYFVLSLQWPNAFCKQDKRKPPWTCRPSPPKQQYFTIHGLWPNKNNCTARPLKDKDLKDYKEQLLEYWPDLLNAECFELSKSFWKREWIKHGSCSSKVFPPKTYINKTIALGKKYGPLIKDALEDSGVKPNGTAYSWEKITQAMKKVTGDKDGFLTCTNDTRKKLQLSEIRICFEPDAETLKNCNGALSQDCTKDLVFASPLP